MKPPLKISIFIFFLLIYLASGGGHTDESDGVEYLALTENMALHHSIKLPSDSKIYEKSGYQIRDTINYLIVDKGGVPIPSNEPLPSVHVPYGLLLSIMGVPLYLIAHYLSIEPIHFVPYFLNSIIISLVSLMIFMTSREIFTSNRISFVLSLVFGVTSFIWPYISSYWQQPLASLTLISSLYFLLVSKRDKSIIFPILAATCLGLTMFAHPGYVILLPGFFIYSIYQYRKDKKCLYSFIAISILFVSFQGGLNLVRSGSITDFGYGAFGGSSIHSDVQGIPGLIISTGYGIFFFYPLFVLIPISMYLFYRNFSRSLALLLIFSFLITWIFYGTLGDEYWAHGQWGPRHLIPILPIITLPLGFFIKQYCTKIVGCISFIILSTLGFFVNVLGVLVWIMYDLSYGWEVDGLATVKNSYDFFTWNPHFSPIIEAAKVLASNYMSYVPGIHLNSYQIIGLAPCRYDNFLYCTFGVIPLVIIGGVIVVLFVLIMKVLYGEKITNFSI